MRREFIIASICTLSLLVGGCRSFHVGSGTGGWERVTSIPGVSVTSTTFGDDGTLFIAHTHGILRSRPADYTSFDTIGLPDSISRWVRRSYAPSHDVLFGLQDGCDPIVRWSSFSGWTRMDSPVSGVELTDRAHTTCVGLADIWGRAANDVYVVGSHATIMHFDGAEWRLQTPSPIPHGLNSSSPAPRFLSIDGDSAHVYAASEGAVATEVHGQWRDLESPVAPESCMLHSVASTGSGVATAGSLGWTSCLLIFESGKWKDRSADVKVAFVDGTHQADGSTVFWRRRSEVIRIERSRIVRYATLQPGTIEAASVINGRLYIVLSARDSVHVLGRKLP